MRSKSLPVRSTRSHRSAKHGVADETAYRVPVPTAALTPARVLYLQRTAGNRAVSELLSVQRVPGGGRSATAMLEFEDDFDDDFDDEYDDDTIDDESAEYLSDRASPPPTVWDFAAPQLHKAELKHQQEDAFLRKQQRQRQRELKTLPKIGARQRKGAQQALDARLTYGHYKTKESLAHYAKQEQWERRKELEALSLRGPVTAGKAALAEAERRKQEEARRAQEEIERLAAEQKEKERQEKAAIEGELRTRLTVNGWAMIPGLKQTQLVDQAWADSQVSESEIKDFINRRKKLAKGNASERLEKAKAQVPNLLKERREAAIEATYQIAKAIVDKAVQAQKKADLDADKNLLRAAIAVKGAAGETEELLEQVIGMMALSSGTTESIDRAYARPAITAAIDIWKALGNTRVAGTKVIDQANLVTSLWSPGDSDDFSWKDRGKFYERTKNFMATVGKHTVNIHVHPPGKWQHPKSQGYPKG